MNKEPLKQWADDVSKAYDILAFGHTERAAEILAQTRNAMRKALAQPAPVPEVCCGEPENCDRPCVPRGIWLATPPTTLPAPVQEPDRAGMTYYKNDKCKALNAASHDCICWTPAAQRTWVGLTEQERNDIEDYFCVVVSIHLFDAIESKLKEKNT